MDLNRSFYSVETATFHFTTEDRAKALSTKKMFKSPIEYHCGKVIKSDFFYRPGDKRHKTQKSKKRYMGLQKRLINVLLQNILDKFKSEIERQNISE